MKYIIKNILHLIREDFFMFCLIVLSILGSGYLVHFSYAMYQNYMLQRQSEVSGKSHILLPAEYELEQYEYNNTIGTYKLRKVDDLQQVVDLSMVKDMVAHMSPALQHNIKEIGINIVVAGYEIPCDVCVQDGKLTYSEGVAKDMGAALDAGRYFTKKEFDAGEKVAVAFNLHKANIDCSPFTEEMLSKDEKTITLGETVYQVIGWHEGAADTPFIPITSVSDDTMISSAGIEIEFNHAMTNRDQLELLQLTGSQLYGLFSVPRTEVLNLDYIYLTNTVLAICVLIVLCAALNIAMIYRYLLLTRKKHIQVFQICGMTTVRSVLLYIGECLMLMLPFYGAAVLLFRKSLPLLRQKYYYINAVYPASVYRKLFFLYFSVSMIVMVGMLVYSFMIDRRLHVGGGKR